MHKQGCLWLRHCEVIRGGWCSAEEGEEEAADKVAAVAGSDEEGEGEEEEQDINAEATKQRKAAQLARIGIRFQAREDAKVNGLLSVRQAVVCTP